MSHKYDTVSRAASRKTLRETSIISDLGSMPTTPSVPEDDSAFRGVIVAAIISTVFFWTPLAVVVTTLMRQL